MAARQFHLGLELLKSKQLVDGKKIDNAKYINDYIRALIAHEVGHTFGLYHTFMNSGTPCGSACDTTGDDVCDTPPSRSSSLCPTTRNTCNNDTMGPSPYTDNEVDQIENYMSYNSCQNMFSMGQSNRMWGYILSFPELQNLYNPDNLHNTGVKPYPVAITSIEKEKDQLKIFPNPASSTIHIEYPLLQDKVITLLNVNGQSVHSITADQFTNHAEVNVSEISGGLYLLVITANGSVVASERIMVIH